MTERESTSVFETQGIAGTSPRGEGGNNCLQNLSAFNTAEQRGEEGKRQNCTDCHKPAAARRQGLC